MKPVLARITLLGRQRLIRPDNTVANRALRLPLHSCGDILAPGEEAVDESVAFADAAGRAGDDALRIDDPGAPFFLGDADAVDAFDFGAGEGVGGREADEDGHCLLVDGDRGGDFAGGEGGLYR